MDEKLRKSEETNDGRGHDGAKGEANFASKETSSATVEMAERGRADIALNDHFGEAWQQRRSINGAAHGRTSVKFAQP